MDTGTEDQFAGSDRGLHDGFRLRGIFGPRERFAHCREARGYCGAGCGSVRDSAGEFFFSSRRRHTCSLRDWSSDVCSSDLASALYGVRGGVSALVGAVVAAASSLATWWLMRKTAALNPMMLMAAALGGFIGKMIVLLVVMIGRKSVG